MYKQNLSILYVATNLCVVALLLKSTVVLSFNTILLRETRRPTTNSLPFYMTSSSDVGVDDNDEMSNSAQVSTIPISSSSRSKNIMSQSLPFLKCPPVLADNPNVPGNVGFDPFGFVQDIDDYNVYQEAEIKHARLAMLAAVGWPISELWNSYLAESWNLPSIIVNEDHRVPAVLNSNLGSVSPIFWGFCLGLSAAIDTHAILRSRDMSNLSYFPGNLGFDPLGLYPANKDGQLRMRLAEIKNGRLAMIAISGFAFQEFVNKIGVVDQTPLLFHPITSFF